ncbi:MAG: outer membrane beta-barrel domain-containing protein [Bacteriovoracia bacterium]
MATLKSIKKRIKRRHPKVYRDIKLSGWAFVIGICLGVSFAAVKSIAANAAEAEETDPAKRVDVEKFKKQYWGQGKDFDVVQNRIYSKEKRLEVSLFGGFVSTDPFLSVKNVGGSVGFHFSEYLSVHMIGWKSYAGPSSALENFRQSVAGADANYNLPQWFAGAEVSASVIYGKLSFIGKQILYYDFHINAGGGATGTESGKEGTLLFGLGQQIYLSQNLAFRLDYRFTRYNENIVDRFNGTNAFVTRRTNWSNVFTMGLSLFLF